VEVVREEYRSKQTLNTISDILSCATQKLLIVDGTHGKWWIPLFGIRVFHSHILSQFELRAKSEQAKIGYEAVFHVIDSFLICKIVLL